MRNIYDYIRPDGVVTMKNGDGGDGAMKTSMLFLAGGEPAVNLTKAMAALFPKPGVLIRCPNDGTPWHSNPACTSGDQTVGWFCVLTIYSLKTDLRALSMAHIKRAGFCQNWEDEKGSWKVADFLRPDCWGIAWRGLGLWFLWPLICLTDFATLVNTLILILRSNPDDVGDDQNHYAVMFTQQSLWPTPISWLARKIYIAFRKPTYGCFMKDADSPNDWEAQRGYGTWLSEYSRPPQSNILGPLWWYHRDSQGAPPMWQFWTNIVRRF